MNHAEKETFALQDSLSGKGRDTRGHQQNSLKLHFQMVSESPTIRELIALLSWFQTPELSLKTPSVRLVGLRRVAGALSYTSGRALLLSL
jgi:hypothetical protein